MAWAVSGRNLAGRSKIRRVKTLKAGIKYATFFIDYLCRVDGTIERDSYSSAIGYGADIVPAKALEERRHLVKKTLRDF